MIRWLTHGTAAFGVPAAPRPPPAQSGKQTERLPKRKVAQALRETITRQVRRKPVGTREQSLQRVIRKQTATPPDPEPVKPQNRPDGADPCRLRRRCRGRHARAALRSGDFRLSGPFRAGGGRHALTGGAGEQALSADARAQADPTAAPLVFSVPQGSKGLSIARRDRAAVPVAGQEPRRLSARKLFCRSPVFALGKPLPNR